MFVAAVLAGHACLDRKTTREVLEAATKSSGDMGESWRRKVGEAFAPCEVKTVS